MVKKPKRKLSAYNKHMSREMKKGRSFKQAVSSWKGGRKSSSKPRKRSTKAGSKKKPKSRAKQKVRKVGRNGFNQQKLFKLARMAALLGPHAGVWMSAQPVEQKVQGSIKLLSGYDIQSGTFSFEDLGKGYIPLLATTAVTKVIPKISGLIGGLL